MLTLIILSAVFEIALICVILHYHKESKIYYCSYRAACEQSKANARVANENLRQLEIQKKLSKRLNILFWICWCLALALLLRLRRVESQ